MAPASYIPAIAKEWQERFEHVFVDECQDINAAQDAILSALGREFGDSNRFLVGDLKQSIYRFRLANPQIFQKYYREWKNAGATARAIALRVDGIGPNPIYDGSTPATALATTRASGW